MEKSVLSAIEQIKMKEQDKETKLKEKREFDATIVSLHRGIKDAITRADKATQECVELSQKTENLAAQLEIQKLQLRALADQVEACNRELNELKSESEQGIAKVWELRSSLSRAVQSVSDECDIWALLMKPTATESLPRPKETPPEEHQPKLENEAKLKEALARKERAVMERDRLLSEPDNGEEFVRKCLLQRTRGFCTKVEPQENQPIKFSTSPAAKKLIAPIIKKPPKNDMPWYQPYSVLSSTVVFMVYFFVLREESDIDKEFTKTLYDRIKGLEKEQLLQTYKFNKENGLSVRDIEQRLAELEAEELKAAA